MNRYKGNAEESKKYLRAFWQKEVIDRPLIAVTAPKNKNAVPVPYLSGAERGDYRETFEAYRRFAENTYFAGEAFPYFECSFGPDQFAAFFGGKVKFSPEGTTWVDPFVNGLEGYTMTLDRSENGYLARLNEFIRQGAEYAAGDFLMCMPDMHSNIDALSAARGPQNFMYDFYDCPDDVLRCAAEVEAEYDFIVNGFAKAGQMEKNGYINWAPVYCEERASVVQCDAICMLGAEMGRRFAVPWIEFEAKSHKHCVYHYDGKEALTHLDDILAIKEIDVVQWVPGAGQPRSPEWMDLLKKIQAAGKGLWIYDWTADEIKSRFKELSPKGLIFTLSVDTPREADELISHVKKMF
ncbi:MAG: hypothetical protein LBL66_01180 [Clostridiales bacterium]|jgi:5-methyltetrahydrofolate--homocysteine methyltransferase|nr:hypothetical protein [Clostridiales bacterium]